MPRRLFDFKCDFGHVTEKYIDVNTLSIHCLTCGYVAGRQVSAPTLPVGVLGPNWASDRAKKQAKESNA